MDLKKDRQIIKTQTVKGCQQDQVDQATNGPLNIFKNVPKIIIKDIFKCRFLLLNISDKTYIGNV